MALWLCSENGRISNKLNYGHSKEIQMQKKNNTNYTELIAQRSNNNEGKKNELPNENMSIDQCDCEGFLACADRPSHFHVG